MALGLHEAFTQESEVPSPLLLLPPLVCLSSILTFSFFFVMFFFFIFLTRSRFPLHVSFSLMPTFYFSFIPYIHILILVCSLLFPCVPNFILIFWIHFFSQCFFSYLPSYTYIVYTVYFSCSSALMYFYFICFHPISLFLFSTLFKSFYLSRSSLPSFFPCYPPPSAFLLLLIADPYI